MTQHKEDGTTGEINMFGKEIIVPRHELSKDQQARIVETAGKLPDTKSSETSSSHHNFCRKASNPPMINYMQLAIEQAELAKRKGEVPIGAIIICQAKVITRAFNLVETQKNPLAHAEILAIQQACTILQTTRLVDCDLYVTLEPCTMCAGAIAHARVRRVYFGAFDPKGGAIDHGARFFNQPTCMHHPEIYGGIRERDCQNLLRSFFVDKRRYTQPD